MALGSQMLGKKGRTCSSTPAYRKPFPGIFSSGKEWPGNGPVGGKPLQQVKVARWDYWKTTQKLEYEW
jgi:hypothetical protein